jgi:UPF0042 nucleotide-binding protein
LTEATDPALVRSGPFVITGLSGSGKSVLSHSLEDLGYHCIDNIPLDLIEDLFERYDKVSEVASLTVVLDVRARGFSERFPTVLLRLRERYPSLQLLFVEASQEVLLRRYSVSRRPHPLRLEPQAAVTAEMEALLPIRHLADLVLNTSALSPHELKRTVLALVGVEDPRHLLSLSVESFSYLGGVPPVASLVFDVRFLPNPFFVEALRPLNGDHPKLQTWFDEHEEVVEAVERVSDLVLYVLPKYAHELKSHVSIAIGCTGGRHRSVFVATRLVEAISAAGYDVRLSHRDRDRRRS